MLSRLLRSSVSRTRRNASRMYLPGHNPTAIENRSLAWSRVTTHNTSITKPQVTVSNIWFLPEVGGNNFYTQHVAMKVGQVSASAAEDSVTVQCLLHKLTFTKRNPAVPAPSPRTGPGKYRAYIIVGPAPPSIPALSAFRGCR
jgi:hypothetical protein